DGNAVVGRDGKPGIDLGHHGVAVPGLALDWRSPHAARQVEAEHHGAADGGCACEEIAAIEVDIRCRLDGCGHRTSSSTPAARLRGEWPPGYAGRCRSG